LAGAKIALPSAVNTVLTLLRLGQQAMYGFFMTAIVLDFLLLLATPLVLRARVWSFPVSLVAFVSSVCVTTATILATALTLGAKYALTAQQELNIRVNIGVPMFVFMWLATGLSDLAFLLHAAMACYCHIHEREPAGSGSPTGAASPSEKKIKIPAFVRRRKVAGSSSALETTSSS
jgi:hypothetical protein